MAFLEPGETYDLPLQNGYVTCKALSFREQRLVIKDIKKLQSNNDPEEAMDLVEKVIAASLVRWVCKGHLGDSAAELLDMITFQEAMDLGTRITEGAKLSSDERKK
jgi:hypothetical protein